MSMLRNLKFTAAVGSLIVVAGSARHASAQTFNVTGFETPDITDNYAYNPVDPTGQITYVGNAGLTDPPSGFDSLVAIEGTQYAFIQQGNGTTGAGGSYITGIGQLPAGTIFSLSFQLAGRNDNHAPNPIVLNVDGVNSGPFTPTVSQWNTFTAGPFTSGGNISVKFIGQGTGADSTSFLDDLKATVVPEPGCAALSVLAFGLLGRRRK